jgi:MOSC domain-containing protein YiiM
MAASSIALLAVLAGQLEPLRPQGPVSGIRKRAVDGRIRVTSMGLVGDAQADRKHHGGVDKALHHYPKAHYAAWREELPQQAHLFEVGGFGENLSTTALTEAEVCVGDCFRVGTALIQVSQGRSPCRKLNLRFGVEDMVRRVQQSGRTGWYYRVLEEGEIGAGDALTLVERPCPEWSVARLQRVLGGDGQDRDASLAVLAALPQLAPGWRDKAAQRLSSTTDTTWSDRLARLLRR